MYGKIFPPECQADFLATWNVALDSQALSIFISSNDNPMWTLAYFTSERDLMNIDFILEKSETRNIS